MVMMVRTWWFLLIKYPLCAFLPNLPNGARRWVLASAASCGWRTRLHMGTAYHFPSGTHGGTRFPRVTEPRFLAPGLMA